MTSPTFWISDSGEGVSVGDYVALTLGPDSVGLIVGVCPQRGLPQIKLTEGAGVGRHVTVWPAQILMKVHRLHAGRDDLMIILKDITSLEDIQRYVAWMESDRGFTQQSVDDQCLRLGEEVGELFRAIRKNQGSPVTGPVPIVGSIDEELADVLIYLCSIANRLNISLADALQRKEEYNETRVWPGRGA